MRQEAGLEIDEYLDRFARPVLIVDAEGRVAAANERAQRILDKPLERILGFLGGEVMECAYARLPEGCGKTVHCAACAIRTAVQRTVARRGSLHGVDVALYTDEGVVEMRISTEFVDGLVRIIVGNRQFLPGAQSGRPS